MPLRASHAVVKEPASLLPHLAREEAERRHQYYLGPEHLLLGLLVEDENPAVRELRAHGMPVEVGDDNLATRILHAHGLTWETVRAGIDRLVAAGVLPGPQPSDAELLATLGIDLDAVMTRLEDSFGLGREAYYDAAQNVRLRPIQPFPRAPGAGTPLICWRGVRARPRGSRRPRRGHHPRALAARPAA